jgi:hypothetical protein
MSKESFYFSHDYNSRNDPKLQKILMKLGQEGKGIYWDLIEMLYEQDGYLKLSELETYAFQMRTNSERIALVIQDFDLFKKDEKVFWSESVLRRLNERKIKSEKARQSAMYRWGDANEMQTHSEGNAIKERKGKNKKEEKEKNPDVVLLQRLDVPVKYAKPFLQWLKYKRAKKQTYKDDKSLKLLYQKILKYSDNDPKKMQDIVDQSMSNNWDGIFELKINNYNGNDKPPIYDDGIKYVWDAKLQRHVHSVSREIYIP